MRSEIFKARCLLETQFRAESSLYSASTVETSLNIMCLSQEYPRFWTLHDRLPAPPGQLQCGCTLFPPLLCCLQEKMPRGFRRSLQTAGKAADTAEVDIDKHFLQFWLHFFPAQCQIADYTNHLSPCPSSSAPNFSAHFLPQSPTPSFQPAFFLPSRLDPLYVNHHCHILPTLHAFCPYHWSFLSCTCRLWAISGSCP